MKYTLGLILLLFLSCTKKEVNLIGNYRIYKLNFTEKLFGYLTNKSRVLNSTLHLKNDSTFFYKNCSLNYKGKWVVKNDTLKLFSDSVHFNLEYLNKSESKLKLINTTNKIILFKIDNSKLARIIKFKDNESIETLLKMK